MIVIGVDVYKQAVTAALSTRPAGCSTKRQPWSAATSSSAGRLRLAISGCRRSRTAGSTCLTREVLCVATLRDLALGRHKVDWHLGATPHTIWLLRPHEIGDEPSSWGVGRHHDRGRSPSRKRPGC